MTLILIAILIVALLFIGFLVHQTLGNNRTGTSARTQANLGTSADTSLQLTSTVDYNHNGVDDYTDMVTGARKMPRMLPSMILAIIRAAIRQMIAAPAPTWYGELSETLAMI